MQELTVGIVGFGLSGRYLQAPFFVSHPGFRLKAIATSRREALQEAFPGVLGIDGLEGLLDDPEIDLVSICSPNETHYPYADAALRAGKHVLVEKPACATAAQLRELQATAAKNERHLFVFQNRRWDSDFLTVRQLLRNETLGRLINYEARFDRWKPEPNAKGWKETPAPSSGMLYDLGAHIIDQAVALFGRPLAVNGRSWIQRPFSSIEDAFDVQLDYDHHRVSLSCSLLVREPTPRYVLHGEKGSFVKYGIDIQEDQLRAGSRPRDDGFGEEPTEQDGILHTESGGLVSRGKLRTLKGSWWDLFENLHAVITSGAASAVPIEEIILQLEIMEAVRGN